MIRKLILPHSAQNYSSVLDILFVSYTLVRLKFKQAIEQLFNILRIFAKLLKSYFAILQLGNYSSDCQARNIFPFNENYFFQARTKL